MAECPVCLEEGVVFVSMACRHELCELCFEKIMKRSKECPLCRMDLRVKVCEVRNEREVCEVRQERNEREVREERQPNTSCSCVFCAISIALTITIYLLNLATVN